MTVRTCDDLTVIRSLIVTAAIGAVCVGLAGCDDSGRAKPFATVHIDNRNNADIVINGCQICGGPVHATGRGSGVRVDTDWNVWDSSELTYTVQIVGGGRVTCRPRQPVSMNLDKSKTYDLRYRITADGRCVVTRQAIQS